MTAITIDILNQLNNQKEAAYKVVFDAYYPRLVHFAYEYVPYADAKSLVQDAFVTLWNKKPEFISEAQMQSYLYTNVKNNCLMFLRHEKVKQNYTEKQLQNDVYSEALDCLDTTTITFQEIEVIIEQTLNELPPRCKEVFELSRIRGCTNLEIAKELEISVKSVEAQITKALKIFRVALKDYLPMIVYFFN